MSDRTPADDIARFRYEYASTFRWDNLSEFARIHRVDQVQRELDQIAAAGFRVVPIPDDNTRRQTIADTLQAWHDEWNGEAFTYEGLAGMILAALDGQPQDRPDRCPSNCASGWVQVQYDSGEWSRELEPCPDAWHVGGSGDTR